VGWQWKFLICGLWFRVLTAIGKQAIAVLLLKKVAYALVNCIAKKTTD
jgi:hypothetical protein